MNLNQALKLAIDALHKEWKYILYAGDSKAADMNRAEIIQAIKILARLITNEELLGKEEEK